MAVLDPERNAVVIRIVYDGPPHAGKTTSVRALARSLMRTVATPLEAAGRTLFFDWMEYTGGLFEGHQIRCQIVSVPGQPDLAERRRALLETADVVIFVADTSDRVCVDRSVEHVRQMVAILRAHDGLPVGVVVQANKRDRPGALPREEVREAFGEDFARTAVTESVADAGVGIRETFVLAVRLALDRIREMMARGDLPRGRPQVDTAEQLLSALEGLPVAQAAPEPVVADDLESALLAAVAAPVVAPPPLPDARVPSGAIWPPVEGRMMLHEATVLGLVVERTGRGDWVAGLGTGWHAHSAESATFDEFDDGRAALVTWARAHAMYADLISPSRCVVLAEAGEASTWRLWQIVKLAPSLRDWLVDSAELDATRLLARLVEAGATLAEAHDLCSGTRLAPTLDSIGRGPRGAQFVALMPAAHSTELAPRVEDAPANVGRALAEVLARELAGRRSELAYAIAHHGQPRTPWDRAIAVAVADR